MINLELEIREQPSILASVIGENEAVATEIVKAAKAKGVAGIYFAARGTSDHACIYAQYLFGILAGLPCTLGTPSVFTKYGAHIDLSKYLVVGVSQSGKAEDVLEVLKSAKADGAVMIEWDAAGASVVEVGIVYTNIGGKADVTSFTGKAVSKSKENHGQFAAIGDGDARGY